MMQRGLVDKEIFLTQDSVSSGVVIGVAKPKSADAHLVHHVAAPALPYWRASGAVVLTSCTIVGLYYLAGFLN